MNGGSRQRSSSAPPEYQTHQEWPNEAQVADPNEEVVQVQQLLLVNRSIDDGEAPLDVDAGIGAFVPPMLATWQLPPWIFYYDQPQVAQVAPPPPPPPPQAWTPEVCPREARGQHSAHVELVNTVTAFEKAERQWQRSSTRLCLWSILFLDEVSLTEAELPSGLATCLLRRQTQPGAQQQSQHQTWTQLGPTLVRIACNIGLKVMCEAVFFERPVHAWSLP
eukprot:symbB.v1.2.036553.t1/scaffold5179.1/size30116/2